MRIFLKAIGATRRGRMTVATDPTVPEPTPQAQPLPPSEPGLQVESRRPTGLPPAPLPTDPPHPTTYQDQ